MSKRLKHHAVLEINSKALKNNFNYLKSLVSPSTKIMAMVKANAYGLGAVKVAQILNELGVDYLGVAYPVEVIKLRKKGIQTPIMVMNADQDCYAQLIKYKAEPTIFSLEKLEKLGEKINNSPSLSAYSIHLEINTGMNRVGFSPNDTSKILKLLKKFPQLKVQSIFSHFAESDNLSDKAFTQHQINVFKETTELLVKRLSYRPLLHIANSSGTTNFPEAHLDMVRIGIGLYGYSNEPLHQKELEVVASLKTYISQIHHVEKGESVSYGRSFIAERKSRIATLSIGYADGVPRNLSNGNFSVKINGKLAPIVGLICMDMLMVDVSEIDCQVGEVATLFGKKPTFQEMAASANTIPYEILTSISPRVKRIFF